MREVLAETTVADAAEVYAAIRRARPGRSGHVGDARTWPAAPTVTLREAMALAAERDSVAREYVTDFASDVRDRRAGAAGAPASAGLGWTDAAVETYLAPAGRGARHPHRAQAGPAPRRSGLPPGARGAAAGGVRTEAGRQALAAFDAELRDAAQHPQSRAPPPT